MTTECPVNTEHIINDDAYFACRDVSLYLYLYRSLFSLYRREEEADDDGNGVDDDDGNDLGDGDGDDGVDDNHGDRRDDADQGDDGGDDGDENDDDAGDGVVVGDGAMTAR